jgi:hypothetical protein
VNDVVDEDGVRVLGQKYEVHHMVGPGPGHTCVRIMYTGCLFLLITAVISSTQGPVLVSHSMRQAAGRYTFFLCSKGRCMAFIAMTDPPHASLTTGR